MGTDRIRTLSLPTPFPAGPVNAYLIGSPPVLVDSGPDTEPSRVALEREFVRLGISPGDLVGVVITHAHPDHAGFAGRLAALGIPVYVHPLDFVNLELDDRFLDGRRSKLVRAGMPEDQVSALIGLTVDTRRFIAPLAEIARPLGLDLPGGDDSWAVIHTPGHTSGHVCLFQSSTGRLLSGDCLLRGIIPAPGLEAESAEIVSHLDAYESSMQTLSELPVTWVYPGHGRSFGHHRLMIQRWRDHRRRREDRVMRALANGGATAYQLTRGIYPGVDGRELLMALADTSAHLDSLSGRGLAAGTAEGDVVVYEATGISERSDEP